MNTASNHLDKHLPFASTGRISGVGSIVDLLTKEDIMVVYGPPTPLRSCLKQKTNKQESPHGKKSNEKEIYRNSDTTPHRVHFAVSLEQVHIIQTYCNDSTIVRWSTKIDYIDCFMSDRATVANSKAAAASKNKCIQPTEWEYVLAYDAALIQYATYGDIDMNMQRTLVSGIDLGYRSLERFSLHHRSRRESCQAVRKSVIQLYRLLQDQHMRNYNKYDEDLYLRTFYEKRSFPSRRWATFMGRIDRIVARRCKDIDEDRSAGQLTHATEHRCLVQQFSECKTKLSTKNNFSTTNCADHSTLP
jgi:hypothetical protein